MGKGMVAIKKRPKGREGIQPSTSSKLDCYQYSI